MSSLTPEQIALLLQQEAQQPTRTRGPKVDPTADRTISGWYKLQHHICTRDCEHRVDPNNPTFAQLNMSKPDAIGNACWNPECMDHTRNKETDRGANIVSEVKKQFICRYCYLGDYLT